MEPQQLNYFEVDGVRYTESEDISIARYKALQKLELQFGFDASFQSLWQATTDIKEAIDQRKSISDIAYINEAVRRGLGNIDRHESYHLMTVALWYNAEGEDPTTYVHADMVAKINRWEAAGLGMGFFFVKAAACVRGFREAWLKFHQAPEPPSAPLPSPPLPPSSPA